MAETGLLTRRPRTRDPVIQPLTPEQPAAPIPPPGTGGEASGGLLSRTRTRPGTGGTGETGGAGTGGTGTGGGITPAPPKTLGKPSSDPAAELNRLLAMDSPLLQEARTRGMQYANARGLLNSSIGGSAAEAEMIRATQPLALQSAGQVAQSELSGQAFTQAQKLQQQAEAAQKGIAEMNVTSNEKIANLDAATQEKLANLSATTQINVAGMNAETQKAVAEMSQQTQIAMGNLEANTQTAIANMNVAANQQANAMSAAVGMSQTQAQMWQAVVANDKIPAAERAKYLAAITATTNANIGLVEQIYNVDLTWATGGVTPTGTPAATPNVVQAGPGLLTGVNSIANTVAGQPPQ
jgi:hypothetical protein